MGRRTPRKRRIRMLEESEAMRRNECRRWRCRIFRKYWNRCSSMRRIWASWRVTACRFKKSYVLRWRGRMYWERIIWASGRTSWWTCRKRLRAETLGLTHRKRCPTQARRCSKVDQWRLTPSSMHLYSRISSSPRQLLTMGWTCSNRTAATWITIWSRTTTANFTWICSRASKTIKAKFQ